MSGEGDNGREKTQKAQNERPRWIMANSLWRFSTPFCVFGFFSRFNSLLSRFENQKVTL
jgi:hypothetical protein